MDGPRMSPALGSDLGQVLEAPCCGSLHQMCGGVRFLTSESTGPGVIEVPVWGTLRISPRATTRGLERERS